MVSTILGPVVAQASFYALSNYPISSSHVKKTLEPKPTRALLLKSHAPTSLLRLSPVPTRARQPCSVRCSFNDPKGNSDAKGSGDDWPILQRWDVPWGWQTASLTSLACGISFLFTGLVEAAAIPYFGIKLEELSIDGKAEILLLGQSLSTAAVLGVLYGITSTFQPLPEDVFRIDFREPFNVRKGWLLWGGVGLFGAVVLVSLTGAAMSSLNGNPPQRETDSLVMLLPLIGSSGISTACLLGITGVLAPILEESVFRGFFMASMTKWVPTPVAIAISAAVFAIAHLTPGEFPQLFILGVVLGLSYAQTRNLLTSITIHAFWNSGVILLLTFLQLQGYDIKEIIQAT